MRTPTKDTALTANATPTSVVAIRRPAIAGPTSRPALWIVELRAWALT